MLKLIKNEDWTWTQETLKAIIERVIERRDEYENEKKNDFDAGVVMGYNFVLDMFKNALECRGYNYDEFMKD